MIAGSTSFIRNNLERVTERDRQYVLVDSNVMLRFVDLSTLTVKLP
ncbi:hypothetical protein [Trichocoleus sp. FACHB-40]|nr:hypothetical protein [Trichocoleus sp. FACHB-40]